MSIAIANKGSVFSGTNLASYATGSYTPTAGRLLIASVLNYNNLAGSPATPTFSGNGLTWTQVLTYISDSAGTKERLTVFAALTGASPSVGAGTADFGGETQLGGSVIVDEVNGANLSNGALGAIRQSKSGSQDLTGTSETITLVSAVDGQNASYGCFGVQAQETFTPGSGYTIAVQGNNAGPSSMFATEYKIPGSATVDISWTTSIGKGGIALEIRGAYAPPPFQKHTMNIWRRYG